MNHTTHRTDQTNPYVRARRAVLNGQPISATTAAQLEALGVDVGALEARLRQTEAFR